MQKEKKNVCFLFGPRKGNEINKCEEAGNLEWYLSKIGAKHWQYWPVKKRLEAVKFLSQ